MKRRSLSAAAVVLLVGLVGGCGKGLDHGVVVGKVYVPQITTYIEQCTIVGKVPVCWPIPITQPECWRLDLKLGQQTGRVCVHEDTWDATQLGDSYAPKAAR